MGCWNHTDAMTQMAICHGDPVRGIFIVRQDQLGAGGTHYSSDWWAPAFLPIEGEYNDYGGIENVKRDWNVDYIEQWLKNHALEIPEGQNQYHERAVVREELDIDRALEAINDERLLIPGIDFSTERPISTSVSVSFVMIHEDVWQTAIAERKGYNKISSVKNYTDKLEEAIKKDIETQVMLEQIIEESKLTEKKIDIGSITRSFTSVLFREKLGLIAQHPNKSLSAYTDIEYARSDLAERFAELMMCCGAMEKLRRVWLPPTSVGSQSDDEDVMRKFHQAVEGVYQKRFSEE